MRSKLLIIALIAILVLVADQATKYAAVQWVGMGNIWTPFPNFPGLLNIVPGFNTGTACGYFPQLGSLFTFAPFLILAIVIVFYRQQENPGWLLTIATGLIVGGAFGNLTDRLRLRYVVDFIQVGQWPVFNIADASVSTAVVLLLFWSLREESSLQAGAEGVAAGRSGTSWKLLLSFLGLLAIVAVIGVLVCVVIPTRFLR